MKILGEKSLSSKVVIGLNVLFAIIGVAVFIVGIAFIKTIRDITKGTNSIYDLCVLLMILASGIIALLVINQFKKIFKNLKVNILFSKDNSKSLNTISNYCIGISAIYFITAILLIFMKEIFTYYLLAFAVMLGIIFAVSAIGIKILNEIYKKAIEYKEENDFTI